MKSLIKKILPKKLLGTYHLMWPFLGMILYGFPSRKLRVIGITGTNGKTTTTHLAAHILEKAGYNVASISTLRFKIKGREWDNKLKMTMPGRMKIHKFMRDAVNAGCTHLVMEVTSEGVKQNRHRFIKFDTAAFTNLTKEHIESHGGFENYKKAKGRFFAKKHRASIINLDDNNAGYFFEFYAENKIGYCINNFKFNILEENSDNKMLLAKDIHISESGVGFSVQDVKFTLSMLGEFNIYNALASIGIAMSQGVELRKCSSVLKEFKGVPGRMEVVSKDPAVIVDYAHTPDALEKVYKTIKKDSVQKDISMICVLGSAGGGRDRWKRPEMGRIAEEYCNKIILTDEDPYNEDPDKIIEEIEKGFIKKIDYEKVLDRREAIEKALNISSKNDVVVITGKGAEKVMVTKRGPIDWDDREIVKTHLSNNK